MGGSSRFGGLNRGNRACKSWSGEAKNIDKHSRNLSWKVEGKSADCMEEHVGFSDAKHCRGRFPGPRQKVLVPVCLSELAYLATARRRRVRCMQKEGEKPTIPYCAPSKSWNTGCEGEKWCFKASRPPFESVRLKVLPLDVVISKGTSSALAFRIGGWKTIATGKLIRRFDIPRNQKHGRRGSGGQMGGM